MAEAPTGPIPQPGVVYGSVKTRLVLSTVCGILWSEGDWRECHLRPGHDGQHAAIVDGMLIQWSDPTPAKT